MSAPESSNRVCSVAVEGIGKRYASQAVLNEVSFSVQEGEVFGLLGPNGAGKTTLMKILSGLVIPDAGNVWLFGCLRQCRDSRFQRWIGLVPQENKLERELTVAESMKAYGRIYGVADLQRRVAEVCRKFHLEEVFDKKIGHLSGGTARRALIARAMLPDPRVILLDEPTVGLDPDIRSELWELIRNVSRQGKTVILSTHYMEEAVALCNRVGMLRGGEFVFLATPLQLQQQFNLFGEPAKALEELFLRLARRAG